MHMEAAALLQALHTAERLKDATRHSLMAYWVSDEFPEADMNKVIRMCLIHDLGEAFTGDIPTFLKTSSDEKREDALLADFKAMDSLEALIQHNESDLSTWSENEYDLNMHYADDKVAFSPYMTALRQAIRKDTAAKIEAETS